MDNIRLACMLCTRAFPREHKQEIVTRAHACLLHFYLIISISCSVWIGVVAYERRIWCVAFTSAKSFLFDFFQQHSGFG